MFQPKNFWSRPAGQHRVADELDERRFPSEFFNDFFALFRRRGVTPQFSRPYHLTGGIQDNKTMLLSTDSDGADLVFSFADLGETSLNRLVDRVDPNPWILLHVPSGQAGD